MFNVGMNFVIPVVARKRFRFLGAVFLLIFLIYPACHLIWGKSLSFYSSTGLKMPRDAKILADIKSSPEKGEVDGESLVIFSASSEQISSFLTQRPWRNGVWKKGPVDFGDTWLNCRIINPYPVFWGEKRVKYAIESQSKTEGSILVVDPAHHRIYWFEWDL